MLTGPTTNAKAEKMLAELEESGRALTEREWGFVETLRAEIAEHGGITPSQRSALYQIHAEKVLGW